MTLHPSSSRREQVLSDSLFESESESWVKPEYHSSSESEVCIRVEVSQSPSPSRASESKGASMIPGPSLKLGCEPSVIARLSPSRVFSQFIFLRVRVMVPTDNHVTDLGVPYIA